MLLKNSFARVRFLTCFVSVWSKIWIVKNNLVWLAGLGVIVIVFGTIYGGIQQAQRSAANSPQIQLAQDNLAKVQSGDQPDFSNTDKIDVAKSLAPFVVIYDKNGKPTSGTGYLNGKLAEAPMGTLQAAKGKEYNAVTWQPEGNVRIAAVTVAAGDNYVLSGRSLKEVEKNEDLTFQITLLGFLISATVYGAAWVVASNFKES